MRTNKRDILTIDTSMSKIGQCQHKRIADRHKLLKRKVHVTHETVEMSNNHLSIIICRFHDFNVYTELQTVAYCGVTSHLQPKYKF